MHTRFVYTAIPIHRCGNVTTPRDTFNPQDNDRDKDEIKSKNEYNNKDKHKETIEHKDREKDNDADKDKEKDTYKDKVAQASPCDTRPKRPHRTLGYDAHILAQKENARPPSFLPRDTWASAIDSHIYDNGSLLMSYSRETYSPQDETRLSYFPLFCETSKSVYTFHT